MPPLLRIHVISLPTVLLGACSAVPYQAMGSVQRSKRYVAELYESGTHLLTNMGANRERIKVRQLVHACSSAISKVLGNYSIVQGMDLKFELLDSQNLV